MALSLSFFPVIPALLLLISKVHAANTVTYDFNITWVTANPDGIFERPTIGINNQWPIPVIEATRGDQIVVNVNNQLGNQTTSLHFHGLFHNGTNAMDGPAYVTQCPIQPGSSFTYNFTAAQSGTYWYHSHDKGQYPDGLRGPLIIHDPEFPYRDQVDEELVLSVSDWYHEQMNTLIPKFLNKANPTGAEPVPQNALLNDTTNLTVSVQPGKTYLFHVINMGAFAGQYLWFEGHNMTIVEVDGVFTDPAETSMIYLSAAQRYSFLLTTKNDTSTNFAFVGSMDTDLFDVLPEDLNWNSTGWLVYDDTKPKEPATFVDEFAFFDDFELVPFDKKPLLPDADQTITLVNTGKHPFHLHGHNFQTIARSADEAGAFDHTNSTQTTWPAVPMRRDTVVLHPEGYVVLRFEADNPGVWLFHCHIEWHMNQGLIATMIEAPLDVQESQTIPQNHFDACTAGNLPQAGNAAGNTEDFLDLKGASTPPKPLPAGFTTRGIVALAFSVLAAVLGCAVIAWYGLADMGAASIASEERRIAEMGAAPGLK
ncbi:multicopper oxidase [Diplocarpon rosae]|nr:multicopper oxidase [Diplocarpon rosae]